MRQFFILCRNCRKRERLSYLSHVFVNPPDFSGTLRSTTNGGTLNISDAIRLPSFASAKVVAGGQSLDRTITSAMVLEAPDIEKWAKRGMLIVTSYFALQNLNDDELKAFFKKAEAIGISGIVFKTERLIRQIPPLVIQLCEEHEIPLLSVNKEVKYESLLMDIFSSVLESNLILLNRFYDVHKQIMKLATTQPTISQILTSLKYSIGDEITFFDSALPSKTSTTNAPCDFVSWDLVELETERYQSFLRYNATLHYQDKHQESAFAIEIPAEESHRYYLIVHTKDRALEHVGIMTVENFASMLQMEALKQDALAQQLFIQHNNTTLDLLLNRYSSHEKIDSALKNLEIDELAFYQVLFIHIRTTHNDDDHRKNDILEAIQRSMRSVYANFAYFMSNDRIVMLYNYSDPSHQLKKKDIQPLFDVLHTDPTLPEFIHLAAISDGIDRYSIDSANKEVLNIYQALDSTPPKNHCIHYSELGCLRVFLNLEDYATLRESIDPRIMQLYEENPDQLTTLVVLCENNLHYQETAKQLFLHPKTVRYRINQIYATYDIDVHDPNDFLQILLAGKIMTLASSEL